MFNSKNKESNNKLDDLLIQLSIAFGKNKAKDLIKQIEKIKKDNPNQTYSFIFNEDGTFVAIKKNSEEEL